MLGCYYFSAYRKYMRLNDNVLVQFCLAHFIRDVKFLADRPNKKNGAHGQRLLEHDASHVQGRVSGGGSSRVRN